MAPYKVNFLSVLNSTAKNDHEAKQRTLRVLATLILIIFLLDVGCSISIMGVVCNVRHIDSLSNSPSSSSSTSTSSYSLGDCISNEIRTGLKFDILNTHNEEGDSTGDLFIMTLARLIVTPLLILFAVYFANPNKPWKFKPKKTKNYNGTAESTAENNEGTTEPLLPPLPPLPSSSSSSSSSSLSALPSPTPPSTNPSPNSQTLLIKPILMLIFFITSTVSQLYFGLKISTYTFPSSHSTVLPILMCLPILLINIQTFLGRSLIDEQTKPGGLYLPAVHRHPLFYEKSLAMHWCDLCSTRIKLEKGQKSQACYRCPLCDFDCCIPCSKRHDASTVSENVLRNDSGVVSDTNLSNGKYFQRALAFAKPEWKLLTLSFALLMLSSCANLALPAFQGNIIDKVVPLDDGSYDKKGFTHNIQIYLAIMLIQGLFSTVYSAAFNLVSRKLVFHVRNSLFTKILVQDVAYFDGTTSGQLTSRLTNDINMMMQPIQSSMSSLLSNIFMLVGGVVMCYAKSFRLSSLAFVVVGPISYLWDVYAKWSKRLNRQMLSSWAEANSIANESLSNIRTVKAFGTEEAEIKSYTQANNEALKSGVKDAWGNAGVSALTSYLDLGTGVLILWFGGILCMNGELSIGELVTFQLYWNMMNNSYQSLQGLVTSFTRSAAGAEKVFSLWDNTPDIDPNKGKNVDWEMEGNLSLKGVKYWYQMRPDNIVLENLNLEIKAGQVFALVGKSGGGKSTIINLLLRFYDPKEGSICVDGSEYKSLKVSHLRQHFGVVAQDTQLFAASVYQNISYGMEEGTFTMDDVVAAAKQAQAHDFIIDMKDGYSTRVGERGGRISGGQRQRIAIARVFLRKPKIILLDEATSALDAESQLSVQLALDLLIKTSKATVVLVAHRLSTVQNADCICVVDGGKIVEQGTHAELCKVVNGRYKKMVEIQKEKDRNVVNQD